MPDEEFDAYESSGESDKEDLSNSKGSDMETEIGEYTHKPLRSRSPKKQIEKQVVPPPSEVPSDTYFTARSEAYYSLTSGGDTSKAHQQK
jgi:hypothetical protein